MSVSLITRLTGSFEPFLYVMVMATGISSNLLHDFVYEARWLRYCSYPMFALACLLFIGLQILQLMHMLKFIREKSIGMYLDEYFYNPSHNVFWGTYPMGLMTILNYISSLSQNEVRNSLVSKRMIKLVYVLWWFDVSVSILCAWGISFFIWQKVRSTSDNKGHRKPNERTSTEGLKSVLVLLVVPLLVAASGSSSFVMTELFMQVYSRSTQLTVIVVTMLVWLHAVIFVFIIITIFFWSLYVNKIPPMAQIFSLFLLLGPMGQASYGILLLTEDVRLYSVKYYTERSANAQHDVLLLAIPWCLKMIGLLLALALLAMGYFFTVIGFAGVASYYRTTIEEQSSGEIRLKRIYHFHKGWFAMTFPMGTMSLGSSGVWHQFNQFVPLTAFRVIGAIYAVICILWTLVCLTGITCTAIIPELTHMIKSKLYRGPSLDLSAVTSKADPSVGRSEPYSGLSC